MKNRIKAKVSGQLGRVQARVDELVLRYEWILIALNAVLISILLVAFVGVVVCTSASYSGRAIEREVNPPTYINSKGVDHE